MEFQAAKKDLSRALALCVRAADRRSTQPILSTVVISVHKGVLTLLASDLKNTITTTVETVGETKDGSVCVEASVVAALVDALADGRVTMSSLPNDWLQVSAKRSVFKLMGQAQTHYPDVPKDDSLSWADIDGGGVADTFRRVEKCISNDEARVNLNGLKTEWSGGELTVIATDGHRLSLARTKTDGIDCDAILPLQSVALVHRLLAAGNAQMATTSTHLWTRSGLTQLSARLSRAKFPPYQQVIPKESNRKAIVLREEMIAALRTGLVLAPSKVSTVHLDFRDNAIRCIVDNPEAGNSVVSFDCDFSGKPMKIGFNATYFIEALEQARGPKATLEMAGELDPCKIYGDQDNGGKDYTAVVMPLRI